MKVVVYGSENILVNTTGKHLFGKSNFDVETLGLSNEDQKYIPKPIAAIFPNIRGIQWYNSNLWEISANDLQPFPYLMNLNLQSNKLMSLEADLFVFTPRLRYINFNNNFLYHIGVDILTNAPYLNEARFQNNPCFNDYEVSPSRMPGLNEQLSRKCPPLIIETTTTLASSSAGTEAPQDCPYECMLFISPTVGSVLLLESGLTNVTQTLAIAANQNKQKFDQFEARIAELEKRINLQSSS